MHTSHTAKGIYRHYIIRLIRSRPHLFLAFLLSVLIEFILPGSLIHQESTRLIVALNSGALFYIILASHMMYSSDHKKILHRSELQDEGQVVTLLLAFGAVIASLVAIVAELSSAKEIQGIVRYEHMALAGLTILSSWSFIHLIFALHYTHDYYFNHSRQDPGGLEFPGNKMPDYADFLYFACVIGTSAQTADVSFISKRMRRFGAVHCIFSFFFNTIILALTINIASGLV